MRLLGPIALAAVALAGCGDDPGPSSDPPQGDSVTYTRSGGIAGTPEELEVDLGGDATLTVGYGDSRQVERFHVSADDLDRIFAAIDEAGGIEEIDSGVDQGCADCFLYEVSYGGDSAAADSVTINDAFADATAPLQELVEQHRPAGVGPKGG